MFKEGYKSKRRQPKSINRKIEKDVKVAVTKQSQDMKWKKSNLIISTVELITTAEEKRRYNHVIQAQKHDNLKKDKRIKYGI